VGAESRPAYTTRKIKVSARMEMVQMKTVLLTGGAGSIGVHVIAHFMHNTKWNIVVIDSFRHKGYRERLDEVCKDHPQWWKRIKVIQHDLVCPISRQMAKEIGPVNHILHLAAVSDVFFSVENPVYTIQNNIMSTLTMLEYAKDTKHDTFVYFSTDEVYGPVNKGEAHPEWDTHRPSNAYSASKAASEDICYPYWRKGEVNLIITNTMNNYGEMQSASKFPVMIQKALENNEPVIIHGSKTDIGSRYYIHSRNVADALLFILKRSPHKHQQGSLDDPDRYHIVGEKCLDNLELATAIAGLMGKNLKIKFVDFHKDNPAHDIHYGLQDNNLRAIGWKQPMTFEESMKNNIEWQQEHREWM
jgi:dTDP-glucose 4,6-dehydratase